MCKYLSTDWPVTADVGAAAAVWLIFAGPKRLTGAERRLSGCDLAIY